MFARNRNFLGSTWISRRRAVAALVASIAFSFGGCASLTMPESFNIDDGYSPYGYGAPAASYGNCGAPRPPKSEVAWTPAISQAGASQYVGCCGQPVNAKCAPVSQTVGSTQKQGTAAPSPQVAANAPAPATSPVSAAAPPPTAPLQSEPLTTASPSQPKDSSSPVVAAQARPRVKKGKASRAIASAGANSYRVRPGDTLMKIAFNTYGDLYRWRDIYEKNKEKIGSFARIAPGTELTIDGTQYVVIEKNGEPYLIRKRDTLIKVSGKLYGTPGRWKELWDNNRQLIRDPNRIYAGFTLYYRNDQNVVRAPASSTSASPELKDRPAPVAIGTTQNEPTSPAPVAPAQNPAPTAPTQATEGKWN